MQQVELIFVKNIAFKNRKKFRYTYFTIELADCLTRILIHFNIHCDNYKQIFIKKDHNY